MNPNQKIKEGLGDDNMLKVDFVNTIILQFLNSVEKIDQDK